MSMLFSRRRLLIGSAATLGAIGLTGCDDVVQNQNVQKVLAMAEQLTMRSQRLLVSPGLRVAPSQTRRLRLVSSKTPDAARAA